MPVAASRTLRVSVLAVALVAAALAVEGAQQPRQSYWALVVNDEPKDEIVIALLDGDDVWLPATALDDAGLVGVGGRRRNMFGQPHVLLGSLAPDITYRMDTVEVVLYLSAAARFFPPNRFMLQRERPAGISYAHNASAYLNYSATWDQTASTTGYGEGGLAMFGNASLLSGFTVGANGRLARGVSTLTVDRPSSRLRWQAGDTVVRSSALGSAPIVGGVSFGRDYSLDPYYYRYPAALVRGTVTASSDVEIFVDGALVRQLRIGPGPYRFDRLPVSAGLGNVRVVVRDPFGRQQAFETNVYLATGVLSRGEHDFQYAVGKVRDDSDVHPSYGLAMGSASHRVGLTDWLTVGYSGEGNRHVVAAGPSLSVRLAKLGELQLDAWVSQTRDKTRGYAAYGFYNFTARRVTVTVTGQYFDRRFANITLGPGSSKPPDFVQAAVGIPVFRFGSLGYAWEVRRSEAGNFGIETANGRVDTELARSQAHTVRLNVRLHRRAQLTSTATSTRVRGSHYWGGFAGLNLVLGRSTTASVTHYRLRGSQNTFMDVNRSRPIGPGIGYRLTASDVGGWEAGGLVELNTSFNYAAVAYVANNEAARANATATLAGSLVATRGGIFFSRPLDLSSAVVEVTGLKNVRVLSDNVPVGRTNRWGRVLIPQLLPYLANRISFVEEDIPFDFNVPLRSQLVAPPYKGAAHVIFRTAQIKARSGSIRMVVAGAETVPSYGGIVVTVGTNRVESPLNLAGEFFLDLPDGRHEATVTYRGQSCTVQIDATTGREMVQKVGVLRCIP